LRYIALSYLQTDARRISIISLSYHLEAKKAIILEGIENNHTRTVYRNAKVAMAGKAKV
jgi:hypothetical protein